MKKYLLFIQLLLLCSVLNAQIRDSRRENSGASPVEIKTDPLKKDAIENNVDLFTGVFNSRYSLGSVSTLEGLSYSLNLNYSSVFSGGDNVPIASGIPYGEGWSLDLPTISITAEAFHNYTEQEELAFDQVLTNGQVNRKEMSRDQLLNEGKLYWLSPFIHIPGMISERFIFRYIDETDNRAVFVPHRFDRYVEAKFDGQTWEIKDPEGNSWQFDIIQASPRNSPNQRIHNQGTTAYDKEVMYNLYVPKIEVIGWYCSEISNPTHSAGQKIYFEYEKFGKFDYFSEYLDPRTAGTILEEFRDPNKICVPWVCQCATFSPVFKNFTTYKDILLRRITAAAYTTVIEELELDYKTVNTTALGAVNMLIPGETGVERLDSLYNFTTVYSAGIGANNISSFDSEESALKSPAGTNFSGWKRYMHIKADQSAIPGQLTDDNLFISHTNPYLLNANGTAAYCTKPGELNAGNDLSFMHGFLESPRIDTEGNHPMPAGDLYEVRTLLRHDGTSTAPGAGFCNFDINIVSGLDRVGDINSTNINGVNRPFATTIDDQRSYPVFSTFNQPVKWNTRSSLNTNHPGYLITSNFFNLPNIPAEFNGIQVQVGPANSDHKFSLGSTGVSAYLPGGTISSPATPRAYFSNQPALSVTDLYPTSPIPSNFGIGQPWKLMERFYAVYDDGDLTLTAPRNRKWWKGIYTPSHWNNDPTLAGSDVYLAGLAVVRYSKNPYMLFRVTKYRTNGEVTPFESPGKIAVSIKQFEYTVRTDTLLNNVVDNVNDDDHQLYHGSHNTILLKKISTIPANPSRPHENFNYDLAKVPAVRFEYSQLRNSEYGVNRDNKFLYPMTTITNELGGITKITYSSYGPGSFNTGVVKFKSDPVDILSAPSVIESRIAVTRISVWKGEDSFAHTDYEYSGQERILTDPPEPVKSEIKEYFHRYLTSSNVGFTTVRVTEPENSEGHRNYSINENYGLSNPLIFGKLRKQTNYSFSDKPVSETEYLYKISLAYNNGASKPSPYKATDSDDYDLLPVTGLNAPMIGQPGTYDVSIKVGDDYMSFFEIAHGRAYPAQYNSSYFTPLSRKVDRVYYHGLEASIHDVLESAQRTGFTFALGNSIDSVETDVQQSIPTSACRSNEEAIRVMTKVKEYNYWDADHMGLTNSPGYKILIPEFTGSNYQLRFDPSWELFSERESSPDNPGLIKKSEYYPYFDLKNYDPEICNTPGTTFRARNLGLRSLIYEKRNVSATPGNDSASISTYTFYREQWDANNDEIATPIVVNFEGAKDCPASGGSEGSGTGWGSGTVSVPSDCIRALNASSPPPQGYALYYYNSIAYFCPERIIDVEVTENEGSGARMIIFNQDPEIPNIGHWLSGKLKYSHTVVQAGEVIKSNYQGLQRRPKGVLAFVPEEIAPGNIQYKPVFPYDTLKTDSVLKRTEYGKVKLIADEKGLLTYYQYSSPVLMQFQDISDPCNNYTGMFWENVFEPISITRGYGLINPEVKLFTWNADYSLRMDTSSNGISTSFTYDLYGRADGTWNGNRLLSRSSYSSWWDESDVTFEGRAASNHIDKWIWNEEDSVLHTREFIDPAGRNFCTTQQFLGGMNTPVSMMIVSGEKVFDLKDRMLYEHKPFVFRSPNNAPFEQHPRKNRDNSTVSVFRSFSYNDEAGGSLQRSADFGINILNGHVKSSSLRLLAYADVTTELGLNASEQEMIFGSGTNGQIIKEITTDEDGNKEILYFNAFGKKLAEKRYSSPTDPIITLYGYDALGNADQVIHPNKQISRYRYNLRGNLIEKETEQGGRWTAMYDRSGNIVVEQDANGSTGTENDGIPYARKYSYDEFARLTSVERCDINGFNPVAYLPDLNDAFYHPSLANSCSWIMEKKVQQPGGNFNKPYGYFLSQGVPEKELFYDKAAIYDPLALLYLSSDVQQKLSASQTLTNNRLSYCRTYGRDGTLNQIVYYGYDRYGNLSSEHQQFSESGITEVNKGTTIEITYPEYSFHAQPKRTLADLDLDGFADLDIMNRFDCRGLLSSAGINGNKLVKYHYRPEDGFVTKAYYYSGVSRDCAEVIVDSASYYYDSRNRLLRSFSRFYSEELLYDNQRPSGQYNTTKVNQDFNYNGNINAAVSEYEHLPLTAGNFIDRTIYGYVYDDHNRLVAADASIYDNLTASTVTASPKLKYGDESYGFDKMSSIIQLNRNKFYPSWNMNPPAGTLEMNYHYDNRSRLVSIDSSGLPARNYQYDPNGNMKIDSYRGLVLESFNGFNLPEKVSVNGQQNKYLYNCSGLRVFKGNGTEKEYYLRDQAGKEIGIFNMTTGTWTYYLDGLGRVARISPEGTEYYISDHLGNTRVVYKATANCTDPVTYEVRSIFDYYPGGKLLRSYQSGPLEKFLSTQHERDKETGLDYRNARFGDADVGVFLSVDPMGHLRLEWTAYNALRSNPIMNIDPEGALDTEFKNKDGSTLSQIDDGSNAVFQLNGNSRSEEYFKFTGYNEKQGGENKINIESVIKGSQDYVREKYTSDFNDKGACVQTYCNYGTMNIARSYQSAVEAMGQKTDISDIKGSARDIGGKLLISKNVTPAIDLAAAQKAAKEGSLVVGYWPGHVFTLNKKGFVNNVGAPRPKNNVFDPKYTEGMGQKFYIIKGPINGGFLSK